MYNTNRIPELTAEFANEFLGSRFDKKLAQNTNLWVTYRGGPTADVYGVRLYSTDIAQLIGGRYLVLDTGGWASVTTKQRMNQLLPYGIGVHTVKGEFRISSHRTGNDWCHPFHDGIILDLETQKLVLSEVPRTVAHWLETRNGMVA